MTLGDSLVTLGDLLCDLRARAKARARAKSTLRGPPFHIDPTHEP